MQKITPFLWFNTQAEEAMNFYVSVFKNAKVITTTRYGDNMPLPKGTVMTAVFELDGQRFIALNGGPHYSLTPAVSFVVNCENQDEVDYYWDRLRAGGSAQQCGWLTDKFGVTWQVVPTVLGEMLGDPEAQKAGRVGKALLRMGKLDIPRLKAAYEGRE
jgi:predicted 3-demethylubiquinone-9 3-methyltransferase (glyoxalase superfamily)